jgi:hypothetical protein
MREIYILKASFADYYIVKHDIWQQGEVTDHPLTKNFSIHKYSDTLDSGIFMKNILKKSVLVALVAALLLPVIFAAFPQRAFAAQENPQDQLERWLYYRGLRACLEDPYFGSSGDVLNGTDNETWSVSDLEVHGLRPGGSEGFGYIGKDLDNDDSNDGTVDCDDGSPWVRAANLFGFDSVKNLVCAMNKAADELGDGGRIKPNPDVPPCADNATKFDFDGGDKVWQEMLTKALENPIAGDYGGDGDRPSFNFEDNHGTDYTYKSLLYLLGKNSLEAFCGGSLEDAQASDAYKDSNQGVSVYIVDSDGTIKKSGFGDAGYSYTYVVTKKDSESDGVNDVYYKNGGNSNEADDRSCSTMAEWTRDGARDYAAWVAKHSDLAKDNEKDDNGGSTGDEGPSCWSGSGPLAWLLCPVLDLLDGAINLLDTWVNNLLFIDSNTGYASDGVKSGNAVMRNIALLLLVPMMMFMVIGTALNFGPFDPYTVKKALPRMMVATIFIVLSLPICQFAVEVSNTIGQGAGNLLLSATNSDIDSLSAIFGSHGDSGGFAGLFLEGGAATLGVFTLTWGVVGSFALVTIVALLIGFVILVMRQVLVMMLIVLAPLAIIVWIFPGNDKLWGIWKGTFQAMLLLYPLVAVLIASGRFVASVVGGG